LHPSGSVVAIQVALGDGVPILATTRTKSCSVVNRSIIRSTVYRSRCCVRNQNWTFPWSRTGSFSKAANDLGLTQPTVTKHVSTIERRLGVRLLNRNSRGISLTEIGSLYFERCKVVLRELEAAESIVGQQRGEIKGTLRIGTSMTFGQQVIAPVLIEFMEQHPNLKFDLKVAMTSTSTWLGRGSILRYD
jgi:Bacterial regulatory helix-turn-helix protein, lysR family/LysR substrate binding domain